MTVTGQAQVGPYETVQLHSTDGSALTSWLTSNGFSVPSGATPILRPTSPQQFDFLAMKLLPGQGVEAMQPVRDDVAPFNFGVRRHVAVFPKRGHVRALQRRLEFNFQSGPAATAAQKSATGRSPANGCGSVGRDDLPVVRGRAAARPYRIRRNEGGIHSNTRTSVK